jgi:putative ABC transport system permease protein
VSETVLDRRGPAGVPAERQRFVLYALTLARRELRGGLAGFRVFLACLVLGVGAIAAIGSLGAAVEAGIRADAQALFGGDVSAQLAMRPANPAERRFLASSGMLSEVTRLRATARSLDGAHRSLIELQAVDAAYPLYGKVTLTPAQPLAAALARRDGVFGAVVQAALARRLNLKPGDRFRVGGAVLRLTGTIESEPDAAFAGLAFGPRVLVAQAALPATGLTGPGMLATYDYRLRLPPGTDAAGWIAKAQGDFPQAGWRLRSSADASPSLQRLIERLRFFLSLVGITALLVGGVGIANAVAGYIAAKTASIATLRCLGASARLVFAAYFAQILALAAAGIAIGRVLGALAPLAVAPLVAPVPVRATVYPAPLAVAGLCGVLTMLAFALWPLAAVGQVAPAALFRDRASPAPRRGAPWALIASVAAAVGLAGLIVLTAPDRRIALWYVGGVLAGFLLFRLAGAAVVAVAAGAPRPKWPLVRLALANLHRPGAPTARVILSLGAGLSVMIAVALVEGNLAHEIDGRLAARAPADFFIDIQPGQLAGFHDIVNAAPGAHIEQVPMLRGRITRLNGMPADPAHVAPDARWALRGDRGVTYSAAVPEGSTLVAGKWWPADYHGPPLVSFDAGLAQGMGLKVGDALTVNVLGREITARIANLRRIDWGRLGISFVMVFAPGTLEAAPQTHLAALYAPPASAEAIVREVTDRFPNISAISVADALAEVGRVVTTIGAAIRIVAAFTLAIGVLVLAGAIAAGHRRRVYDAVVLKVLGATRGAITLTFAIEHGLLGLAAAVVAAGLGTLAAWLLVSGPMHLGFVFLPGPLVLTAAGAVLLTLLLGFAGAWRALGAKPAAWLRNE